MWTEEFVAHVRASNAVGGSATLVTYVKNPPSLARGWPNELRGRMAGKFVTVAKLCKWPVAMPAAPIIDSRASAPAPHRTVSTIDCRRSPPMLRPAGPSSSVAGGWWRRHGPRLRRDKEKQQKGHKRNARRRRRPATRSCTVKSKQRNSMSTHARICGGLVASNVTTGQIDHRTVCGNRFNVSDGRVKEQQKHKYTCPHCGGLVASNVMTGQIDHRTVCGNRFNVSDGRVKEQRKHEYTCPHCGGLVASNVMTGQIDHWTVCGNRFCVRNGTVQEKKKHQYTCPHCGGLVASNLTTGQIDHRTVCGNRFYVTAGKVKDQKKHAQKTRGKK